MNKNDSQVNLLPVPMDAEAYVVQADLTVDEQRRLRLQWEKMNEHLQKPKFLLVLPEKIDLQKVPSSVIRDWIGKCEGVLKERGESDTGDTK